PSPRPTRRRCGPGSWPPGASGSGTCEDAGLMDLSFTAEEAAFAEEVRSWLADHLDPPGRFETVADEIAWGVDWQARLAADRWVGLYWPTEYGGRSASPVEVA